MNKNNHMKYNKHTTLFFSIMMLMKFHSRALAFCLRTTRTLHHGRFPSRILSCSVSDASSSTDDDERQDKFKREMSNWRGSSRSTSPFVTHFIASDAQQTVEEAIHSVLPNKGFQGGEEQDGTRRRRSLMEAEEDPLLQQLDMKFRHDPGQFPLNQQLTPLELIALGAIWYLPAGAPRDPALGLKPVRLEVPNLLDIMEEGDYLRVHHSPRRFPEVNQVDWGRSIYDPESPGVIVSENQEKGYIILNKPAGVPVHPTVDNALENVAGAVGRATLDRERENLEVLVKNRNETMAEEGPGPWSSNHGKQKEDPLLYVVTPQRLDQNTSGLFVVGTKKVFASYFAQLLRKKTDAHVGDDALERSDAASSATLGQIQKKYRCLVCIMKKKKAHSSTDGDASQSLSDEVERLRVMCNDNSIVRHYLEPTKRAPRIYSSEYSEDWLECLMKITNVGNVVPATDQVCTSVWKDKAKKPSDCVAVVQVEVELLTGRAHQIRGQLSALGFPLCGDAMYGGVVPSPRDPEVEAFYQGDAYREGYQDSDMLALQCCELRFLDPDYIDNKKGDKIAVRSKRWNTFHLDAAWWTEDLVVYEKDVQDRVLNSATTNNHDLEVARKMKSSTAATMTSPPDTVGEVDDRRRVQKEIQNIQLSPGQHKYVIIKATHPGLENPEWFVKTASPRECGGPFHADVARDLVKKLNVAGYDTIVMGGGRIDYDESKQHARVYGFSYGFGKGDHEFVSLLIEKHGINASFDDSDELY